MWSLVPRPIRRYRREHPYSHPLFFLCVDFLDSSLKLALTCGVIYGVYSFTSSKLGEDQSSIAASTVRNMEPLVVGDQTTSNETAKTMLITASSVATLSDSIQTKDKSNRSKTLLDEETGIRWIAGLPDSYYTIQYASSVDKAALIAFANNHLQRGAVIYPFKVTESNGTMYGVASGLYDSLHSALLAIDNMPDPLLEHGPWVRPVRKLQKEVRETSNRPKLSAE